MKFIRYTDRFNIKRLENHDISLSRFIEQSDFEEETLDKSNSRVEAYIKSDPDFISNVKITIDIEE